MIRHELGWVISRKETPDHQRIVQEAHHYRLKVLNCPEWVLSYLFSPDGMSGAQWRLSRILYKIGRRNITLHGRGLRAVNEATSLQFQNSRGADTTWRPCESAQMSVYHGKIMKAQGQFTRDEKAEGVRSRFVWQLTSLLLFKVAKFILRPLRRRCQPSLQP